MSAIKNIFLSDIHIGPNKPTNWYQKDVHQKYLKAILMYVQNNADKIKDFVILGDWFDLWTYPPTDRPPSVFDIFDANKDIFYPSDDGDFVSCLDSIQGNFYYVNGNHDMSVSCEDINTHFQPLSKKRRMIVCGGPKNNTIYESGGIYGAHGNSYSLTCMPDNTVSSYSPLPLGYYITRTVALLCQQKLDKEGKANAAMLSDSGDPAFSFQSAIYDLKYIAELLERECSFAQAILFDLIKKTGQKDLEKMIYTMPDGSTINAKQVTDMFSHVKIEIDVWHDKALKVDIENSLDSEAEQLAKDYKVVLFGHTHTPELDVKKFFPISLYANTGFNCAAKPDMSTSPPKKSPPTFVEVEEKQKPGEYRVLCQQVDYPYCTISLKKKIG